ncbi:hypothetical protein SKAU_G00282510 [Synaphobranchus kaupii]|uniref:Uncharacterized protein n=1 Tax=Synaphobranchus kaupii TaxID=118154 RepID=A0A9Q1EXF2_SYNKA|nr:hypothetical protein SKAU_G00282510 [Synaphobranchus kaupii]
MDVTTRWKSSYDMLDRYLEQQAAVTAALMSPEVRRNARDIDTLDVSDITDAKDLVKLLKPLKTATTVLCDEKLPTVSLIIPMKRMIEQAMTPDAKDSAVLANTKSTILNDIFGQLQSDTLRCPVQKAPVSEFFLHYTLSMYKGIAGTPHWRTGILRQIVLGTGG